MNPRRGTRPVAGLVARLLGVLALLLPISGWPGRIAAAAQATPMAGTEAVPMVEQQLVDVPGLRLLSMSPDGRWLLGLDDEQDRLCGIAIATMTEEGCADVRAAGFPGPVEHSIAWSPAGSHVAMTEDALHALEESDIWVFAVATGELANLTDDGASDLFRPGPGGEPLVDLFPTWSPDGQAIAFARAVRADDGWGEGGIFRIATTGGQPEQIAPLPAPGAFAVYPELRWSADGRFLAYSLLMPDRDDPNNGLWVVEADGTNQRQILVAGDLPRPLLIELSTRGVAFVAAADYVANPRAHTGSRFAAVDLLSGEVGSLDEIPPPMWGAPLLPMLTFSPDGGRLLFVTVEQPAVRRLLVYDLDRAETSTVLDPIESWFGGAVPTGLVWGRNDLFFVPGPWGRGILLQLAGTGAP